MNSPRIQWFAIANSLLLASLITLTSCSVDSSGPVSVGASHGSLGSADMADYYYKKAAGWTYVFQNKDVVTNEDGSTSTRFGANDTVRTLGFAGISGPNGDSLFKVAITYRVLEQYAGRGELTVRYISNGNSENGAFITQSFGLSNEKTMNKRPRPVSTDTILAGVAGHIRTMCDDFESTGASTTWQTDTLWFSAHGDSVFIWERFPGSTSLNCSRLIFCRDFKNGTGNGWMYDLIFNSTNIRVREPDASYSTAAATFSHTTTLEVYTPEVSDNMPISEYKWYACGVGQVHQYDQFYVSTNGKNRIKHEFTRDLIALKH